MDPFTIGIGVAALIGAWVAFRKPATDTASRGGSCGNEASVAAAEAVAGQAAAGGVAGSSVPGIGTGAGAGIGAGLALVQISQTPCGKAWLKHGAEQIRNLGAQQCAAADSLFAKLKAHGVAAPAGYANLSCDQKLALALSLATPLGIVVAGAAELIGTGAAAASRTIDNATHTNTTVGSHGTSVAGHKIF